LDGSINTGGVFGGGQIGPGVFSFATLPGGSITADQSLTDWWRAFHSTAGFVLDFFAGHGKTDRTYTADDYRTKNLAASMGVQDLVKGINKKCEAGIFKSEHLDDELLSTAQGGINLFLGTDKVLSPVGAQVGGYAVSGQFTMESLS
jgi:hypothetical protein